MSNAQIFQPAHHENFSLNPDVAIIGAGRSCQHLLSAFKQQAPDLNVAVLDRYPFDAPEGVIGVHDEAIALTERHGGWLIKGITGATYATKKIILATGFYPPMPPHLHLMDYAQSGRYINDPRTIDFQAIDREENILIMGSGLYMVQIVKQLTDQKHLGEIFSLSRHGLLPQPLGNDQPFDPFFDRKPSNHLPTLLSQLRVTAEDHSWPSIIDGLEPHTKHIWQSFSVEDKKQFLRHVRRYWHVARNRIPDSMHDLLFRLKASGQLHVLAGYYRDIEALDNQLAVQFYKRGTEDIQVVMPNKILNATGPNYDFNKNEDLLIQNLLNQGYLQVDMTGFGLHLGEHCESAVSAPRVNAKLFAMGPLAKGKFYDSISDEALAEQSELILEQINHA